MGVRLPPEMAKALGLGAAKGSKFRAESTAYNGRTYDSKAEARFAANLDLGVKAGVVAFWIPQPLVVLDALQYRPDFLVAEVMPTRVPQPPSNRHHYVYFVDVKGAETQRFRDVRKMWAAHGPAELRVVKRGKHVESIWPPAGGHPGG